MQVEKAFQADQKGALQFQAGSQQYKIHFEGGIPVRLMSTAGGMRLALQCSVSWEKACRQGHRRGGKHLVDCRQQEEEDGKKGILH